MTVLLRLMLGIVAFALVAPASSATYGPLAPGAISTSEQSGVRAEICRDHLVKPSLLNVKIPQGYRLSRASELAAEDPKLAELLARSPDLGGYFAGSLCFMLVENFDVDGVRVIADKEASAMAFWWARASRVGEPDARMRGKSQWLQLASWYANKGTDQARIARTDPMAQFVPIEVSELEPGVWRARLQLAGEIVEASIMVTGPHEKRKAAEPGFMTVPFTGKSANFFTVFTYFGHHHAAAAGKWSARGAGAFTQAFGTPGESETFETFFQSRWQARAALYQFNH